MTDESVFEQIVMCSDGSMGSIHPTQIRALVAEGTVFWAGGRWRTELTGPELAHRVTISIGVCDFCSRPNPSWAFGCRDFKEPAIPGINLGQQSIGEWAACEACAAMIRQGRWWQLGTRCLDSMIRTHPELAGHRDTIRVYLRKLHDRFRANRTGPPTRITPGREGRNGP